KCSIFEASIKESNRGTKLNRFGTSNYNAQSHAVKAVTICDRRAKCVFIHRTQQSTVEISTTIVLLIALLIFVVALLYSTVGHAGASGYLAAMALFSLAPAIMKPTALTLNIIV